MNSCHRENKYPLANRGEWWGDADYKERGGNLVYVAPDIFLNKAKPLEDNEDTQENINDLIDHVNQGRSLDPLVLYGNDKTKVRDSDGRHRAHMAKSMGMLVVPVIDFTGEIK